MGIFKHEGFFGDFEWEFCFNHRGPFQKKTLTFSMFTFWCSISIGRGNINEIFLQQPVFSVHKSLIVGALQCFQYSNYMHEEKKKTPIYSSHDNGRNQVEFPKNAPA